MRNKEYWQQRFEQLESAQVNMGIEYYETLDKQFNLACSNIQADIERWYMRFADNEGITLSEARRRLNSKELEEFRWTVEEYIEKGKTLKYSDEWARELENASARVHISRLEALKLQLQQQVEVLYSNQVDGLESLLTNVYEYGFYHTCFEIEKGIGLGVEINRINPRKLNAIIHNPWAVDGSNFSARIWGKYRPDLVKTLHTEMTQACIRGDNPKKIINTISKKFGASKKQAGNLVMTEQAYFSSLATQGGYQEIGVEEYEILATLDLHTSEICRSLDGKPFKMSEYEPWVTAPPFHNRCRTTTIPRFSDDIGERIARGADGKQYTVPANMTYEEWYNKYVKGNASAELAEKKLSNEYADRKQYEAYKKVLGKDVPKSFDKFQELKYTDSNSWGLFKDYAKSRSTNMISSFVSFDHYQQYNNLIEKQIVGLTTVDGIQITGQSKHFIERVFGTTNDPKVNRPRSGVEIDDIKDALLNGNIRKRTNDINSVKYITQKCIVSVNPNTGNLIQVNPQ